MTLTKLATAHTILPVGNPRAASLAGQIQTEMIDAIPTVPLLMPAARPIVLWLGTLHVTQPTIGEAAGKTPQAMRIRHP